MIYDGDSFYSEKFGIVFFRGDGVQTVVTIPDNITRIRVRPYAKCTLAKLDGGSNAVTFDRAIEQGRVVRIYLEQEENPNE